MCGVVGVVSNCTNGFSIKEMAVFSQLLFLDTVRGFDSTGVFGVHNNKNVVIHKEASNGLDFLSTKEYKQFRTEMVATGKFVVGHNRAATRGTIVDKNAHPFWVDDKIVLVQNGTYKGDHKHLKNTDVDTDAVAHVIAETETVEAALQKINASYALVWYNAATEELNLIRNKERPLFIAQFFGSGLIFASEGSMIEYAAKREDLNLNGAPIELPAHTHVVLKLDGKGGYTRTDTEIDASYRFPAGVEYEETPWYGHYRGHIQQAPHQPNPLACAYTPANTGPRETYGFGKSDVKTTFAETMANSGSKYFFKTQPEAVEDIDAVNSAVYNGCHYIEMIDYIPANTHKDCAAWHVYGAVICDATDNGPATLVHWIVYDKTEEEIMEMCTQTFYKVKLSTIICRTIRNHQGEARFLNTVFASSSEIIEGVPN